MSLAAASNWYTAAELAAMGLPGLPCEPRRLRELAKVAGWAELKADDGTPMARERRARGGGIEFNASVLPPEAQLRLRARMRSAEQAPPADNDRDNGEDEAWERYLRLPAKTRTEAERRLSILDEVEALVSAGSSRTAAKDEVGRKHGEHRTTIQRWQRAVAGLDKAQWLPRLAPNFTGGGREAEIPAEAWEMFQSDMLRPSKPAASACYNRVLEDWARPNGIEVPSLKTFMRRYDREVGEGVKIAKRDGKEAARQSIAPVKRSVRDLHAMELVNVDGHQFDVFVRMENGEIIRPIMVGIQDVYSRKLLAWRIGATENIELVRLTFFDLFRNWGLPKGVFMDNGRAFASKPMTGGAKTRFRFTINPDDATGVLPSLGVATHFVLPYRGSSKPIERAWGDVCCEYIAKHPAMEGAYTGNSPNAKPENYRSRAIPIATFRAHVDRQIALHNARLGRKTETAKAAEKSERSFDQVFAASYEASVIRKATEAQLRLAYLQAAERTCHRQHGGIELYGNTYWSEALREIRGQRVIVRFDPDDLHGTIDVYSRDGQFLCNVPVQQAFGFKDQSGAVFVGKREKQARKAIKQAEAALELRDAAWWEQMLAEQDEPTAQPPKPSAGAVQPVRHGGQTAAALKPTQQAVPEPENASFEDAFDRACERRFRVIE